MDKILVADDDLDLLLLMQYTLTKEGYEVKILPNGKAVLPVVETFEPDLVILDINLGDADGRELCQQIKAMAAFHNLPIILYSAEDFPDLQIADCHASAFIKKPFTTSQFLQKVNELIPARDENYL